ncbi:MAG: sigma-70 family RNA polymerase sigma factor [Deltaproteobacteria bacterium]|nr:sigma-70 family RNA polymerase sigma factor [Deltaproteobacteria bacterium]
MEESRSRAAALYREYGPLVYRRCLRLLRDPEAAKDATQEVFMKLVRDMERLSDRETVLPWLYRVAMNHCLNLRRNSTRRGEDTAKTELEIPDGPARESYPDRHLVQQVLGKFDETTQTVAVGVLVDGLEHEEVAEMLGVSRRTVARKLDRFLENARKMIIRSET